MVQQITLLQKLEQRAASRDLAKFSQDSYDWYRTAVQTIGGKKSRNEILADAKRNNRFKNVPKIGYMYTYVYDALHKDTLPYFDAFPLIILVGPAAGGFYGLNLHYLPPKPRAVLFDNLISIASDKKYDDKTKMQISYKLLSNSTKFKLFQPCLKHYLFKQLRSRLVEIPSSEWEGALFLPTANFVGAKNTKVWSDSMLQTKGK